MDRRILIQMERPHMAMNVGAWRALADPTRWTIVQLLADKPLSVTELCDELEMAQSSVSWHLDQLKRAELVEARQRGYFSVYQLRADSLDALAARLATLARRARQRSP